QMIFLEEQKAGIEPVNARIVKDIIKRLRQNGVTVFLTTHDMTVADELSDRVAFIVNGRVEMLDTPKALKLKYGKREVAVEYLNGTGDVEARTFAIDGLGDNGEFVDLLRKHRVETIHSQETTLEQIFIGVTGQELK
ncbi:MAG: ABC transporter ATP-binding protein, partial [Dehalococcoidales bacterium]|nr:ABC transporter ATP-binding protein [Dehalococcoidales bacterium]